MKKEELYIILKPSVIEGVGVFTERRIDRGEYIKIWDTNDWMRIGKVKERLKTMCDRFGDGKYRPRNFTRMSLAWFLDHSKNPNVRITKSGRCYAIRAIKKSEELLIDYAALDENVNNSLYDVSVKAYPHEFSTKARARIGFVPLQSDGSDKKAAISSIWDEIFNMKIGDPNPTDLQLAGFQEARQRALSIIRGGYK